MISIKIASSMMQRLFAVLLGIRQYASFGYQVGALRSMLAIALPQVSLLKDLGDDSGDLGIGNLGIGNLGVADLSVGSGLEHMRSGDSDRAAIPL